jgi:hypothetical protein
MRNEEHQTKVEALSLSPMIPAALASEMFNSCLESLQLAACNTTVSSRLHKLCILL